MTVKNQKPTYYRPLLLSLSVLLATACGKEKNESVAPSAQEQANAGTSTNKPASQEEQKAAEKAAKAKLKQAQLAKLPPLPGVGEPNAVKFPKPLVSQLPNGLEVIVLEDHETPIVELSLHVKAGKIYSPNDKPSIAAFTAYLLGEGTKNYSKAKLDAAIDATGGNLSSSAGDELVTVSAEVIQNDQDLAFKLVAEQGMQPTFPQASFDKIKDMMIQEVAAQKAEPFGLVHQAGRRVIFGEASAYGRLFPSEEQIKAMTREDVLAFYQKHYVPNNALLVVAGDITQAQAQALAKKYFGKWKQGEALAHLQVKSSSLPEKTVVHIIDRQASAQATILVAVPAAKMDETDWLHTETMRKLLAGAGLSSRLNQVLREELGLTYGAGAFYDVGFDGGAFFAGGGTKTKSAAEFTTALLELLKEPATKGVDNNDLSRTLRIISGRFALEVEGVGAAANKTVTQRLFALPEDFWERYRSDVESITPEQLKGMTKKMFIDRPLQIIVVGKADKLKEEMSKFGEVRVYDMNLQRQS